MFNHIHDRLQQRGIDLKDSIIEGLAYEYNNAAIVVYKFSECKGQNYGDYRSRTESNGELVVMIVRDNYPVTIMYRRLNQPLTAQALRVENIVIL